MKNLYEHIPGVLPAQPAAEAFNPVSASLEKALLAWPELKAHPQQLNRIRHFAFQELPAFAASGLPPIERERLREYLTTEPPFWEEDKLTDLFIILEGVQFALQHFQLQDGPDLDHFLKIQKMLFLDSIRTANAHATRDRPCIPGESLNGN